MMITWKKGESIFYSKRFNLNEFACKCSHRECVEQKIETALIDKIEKIRDSISTGIIINSGYRCQAHQDDLARGGAETALVSQHVAGKAADLSCRDMRLLEKLCIKEFRAVGVARGFIHVDLREDKTRRWGYVRS